jgi:two-component sensor histidine kinase
MVIKKTNMNQIETIQMLEEMQMRIDSLQHTIDKMIMSGKFDNDDPRFAKLEDNIHTMETMMMQVARNSGIKPYNINWPTPKKYYNGKKKKNKDQD